ncbi:MAG: BatA domain-containing protein [Cytophagaceae bacterium]
MSFIQPQFLFGLLAVSIPILIHLFNFQRPKKLYFTNVKFLKAVNEASSSKRKLKHILILISRILFLSFIVFAFAQPFIEGNNPSITKGKSAVAFYLDNSYSMQNEYEGSKLLDEGIRSINKLSEIYPSSTSYSILTNEFSGQDQFFRNKEKLQERLTEIVLSNNFRDGKSIHNRILNTLKGKTEESKHVFLFSDFQKTTFGDLNNLELDSSVKYYFVPCLSPSQSNVYVDSLWLVNPFVKSGENNQLQVKLVNAGNREVNELPVKLYIEDVQVSTVSVSLKPNMTTEATFLFNVNTSGEKKCRINFDDHPVSFDNQWNFIINVSPKINILNIAEKDEYIGKVYSGEDIFKITTQSPGSLDYTMLDVSDLVILNQVEQPSSSLIKAVSSYIGKGGTVFIIPNKKPEKSSYTEFLKNLSISIADFNVVDTAGYVKYPLEAPDFNNPFFSNVFEKKDNSMNMPYGIPVLNPLNKGNSLLRQKNGDVFLSEYNFGSGKIYLVCSPLVSGFTNFYKHSVFVPIMYKIAFNSKGYSGKLAYTFQDKLLSIDLEEKAVESLYYIESKDFKLIPEQRALGRTVNISLPSEEMKPGFYSVKLDNKLVKTVGLNFGKEESDFTFYTQEELKEFAKGKSNVTIYSVSDSEQFFKEFKEGNIGVALWKYCLILALMFLLLEIIFIRFL